MKAERGMLIAWLLNLFFSLFEFAGGLITGSAAVLSDAVHDMGDAVSIGVSWLFEKKSGRQPDERYTYGYGRYAVTGSILTVAVLLAGSLAAVCHAVYRIVNPVEIRYDGMLVLAMVGVAVNFAAAWITRGGTSLNRKAVNLHMLEDVLGWVAVLVGAVIMRFTGAVIIDPLLSIGVALWIAAHAAGHLKEAVSVLMEGVPQGMDIHEIAEHISGVEGVLDLHHLHIWSLDGQRHCATLHVVTDSDPRRTKELVRKQLQEYGVGHVTIEPETPDEHCNERVCHAPTAEKTDGCGHHRH